MSDSPQSPEQSAGPQSRAGEHLDQQVSNILDRVVRELSQDIETRIRQSAKSLAEEMVAASGPKDVPSLGGLVAAVAKVDGQDSQARILATLLDESQPYSSRAAFLVANDGGLQGWGGRGFGERNVALDGMALASEDASWKALGKGLGSVRLGESACAVLCDALEADGAAEGVLIPFVLGGQIAGAVYADRTNGTGSLDVEAMQLLTHSAAEAVETLSYRSRGGSPALRISDGSEGEEAEGLPLWSGVAAGAAAAGIATAVATSASASAAKDPVGSEVVPTETTKADTYIETTPVPIVDVPVIEEPTDLDASWIGEAGDSQPEDSSGEATASTDDSASLKVDASIEAEVSIEDTDPGTAAIPTGLDFQESAPGTDEVELDELTGGAEGMFETSEAIEAPLPVAEVPEVVEPMPMEEVEAPVASTATAAENEGEDSNIWALEEEHDELTATGPMEAVRESAEVDLGELAAAADIDTGAEAEAATEQPAAKDPGEETSPFLQESPAPEGISDGPAVEAADPNMDQDPTISLEPGKKTVLLDLDNLGQTSAAEADTAPIKAIPREKEGRFLDASEDPTLMTSRTAGLDAPIPSVQPSAPTPDTFASPPSGSFAVPSASGESTSVTSFGDSVVRPPENLEGPGLAFSGMSPSEASSGDRSLHEQAKRLARLLVSEIKLYNEEIIEEGRRSANIYDRLREDIDRSRQLYEERVDPRVRSGEDYFHQELVQLLAGGDASLLGI